MLKLLERDGSTGVAARVRTLAEEAGMLYSVPDKLGERELTRQTDLARLVRLSAEIDDGALTCAGFAAELRRRYDPGSREVRGVHLLTYHRAKGLEFDAVFLPRLDEKELPTRLARTEEERQEERRLLYVGITRARRFLAVTWSRDPSPFLSELGIETRSVRPRAVPAAVEVEDPVLFDALAAWRKQRAEADAVPAFVVFHNSTLAAIAGAKPRSINELASVPGIGPAKLDRYGEELLAVVGQAV
jgi:DNA helicase-2/ATP-dependent DNA helicase PcrA